MSPGALVDFGWIVSIDREWAPFGSDCFLSRASAIKAASRGKAMVGHEGKAICLVRPLKTFWVGRLEVRRVAREEFTTRVLSPCLVRPQSPQAS